MMRWLLWMCLLGLVWVPKAETSNYVCGDATKLGYYAQGIDPSTIPVCAVPFAVAEVPEAEVPAQDALYATVPPRHLKVIDGLMVEMTQAEKDAVDLPAQQQAAATGVAKQEMQTNEVCANNTLPEITAYWKGPGGKQAQLQATIVTLDTAIAAVTAGPARTAIQAARDALVAHMTMFIDNEERQWRYICAHGFVRP